MNPLAQHYALLLGLVDHWQVDHVDLDLAAERVEIRLSHAADKVPATLRYALQAQPLQPHPTGAACRWSPLRTA